MTDLARARPPRGALLVAAAAVAATAVLAWLGWPADRYAHNDFAGFWLGSRAVVEGLDPYDGGLWLALHQRIGSQGLEIVPRGSGYGYPFTTAVLFVPFALLPLPVAAPAWLVAQATLALVALAALARRLIGPTLRRDLPVLVALGATSQPAWVLAEGGNAAGFVLAAVAGATALLLARRPVAAGAVASLALVKPHLIAVAIPLVLVALPWSVSRRVLAGAALAAGPVVAASFLLRPQWLAEWLVPLGRLGAAPVGRATAVGLLPAEARPLAVAAAIAAAVAFALWSRRRRDVALVVAAAVPLSLLAAPYAWSYDHLVLLVTVATVLALIAPLAGAGRARFLALLALVVVALPWVLYVLAFSTGDERWSALVPLTMLGTLALASLTRDRGSASR